MGKVEGLLRAVRRATGADPSRLPTKRGQSGYITMNHPIVYHILYGDINEMPLDVLGDDGVHCDDEDIEQRVRCQAAASVAAWLQGRLHRSGLHLADDLIPRSM